MLSPHQYGCQSRKYDPTLRLFLPLCVRESNGRYSSCLIVSFKKSFLATQKQL
ncbi:hypothetical protein HanRHA438_Chr03g0109781 [Helianthus annuus]|nr:hypothetical protein HanRHA438_Chr03g0109781 [Helianthus annuus]